MPTTINTDGAWSFQSMDTALIGRLHDAALLAQNGTTGLNSARPGVIPSVVGAASTIVLDLYVQALASPGMGVQVLPGAGVIARSGQGSYLALNTQTQGTLTIAASNPTNPRIDLVYWQVLDHAFSDAGSPALGGYAQLGVVTGTPAGTPTVPALPSNAIPLAQVAVAANAPQIVQGNITQVRKSAGLSGSSRLLLEGDLLSDPGLRTGEPRSRYHSTYGVLNDVWDSQAQVWRGTQVLTMTAGTWQNSTSNIAISNSARTNLVIVSIADPGWPYVVRASGQIDWNQYGTFTAGAPPYVQAFATIDTNAGTLLAQSLAWAGDASNTFDAITPLPMSPRSGTLTGAHTIVLSGLGKVAVNCPYTGFTAGATYLSVVVSPATI